MKLSIAAKRLAAATAIAALPVMVIGAIIYRSPEALLFIAGAAMTTALNVLKVIMLERAVNKAVEKETGAAAGNYIRIQYLLRFFLTGAVLVGCALLNHTMLWGAAAGIFTLQIAALTSRFHTKGEE